MAADNDPTFVRVDEARKSVLEPYAGNLPTGGLVSGPQHGRRVGENWRRSAQGLSGALYAMP
jgi:hypothetical protein